MDASAIAPLVKQLLLVVSAMSSYPVPAHVPEVAFVRHAHLEHWACDRPCGVLGWSPRGGIIYLDDRLDPVHDPWATSILVHELVHYEQQESGAFQDPVDCRGWGAREKQAYEVQFRWLMRNGYSVDGSFGGGPPPWTLACRSDSPAPVPAH